MRRSEPEDVIRELAEQFQPIMEQSPDGVYLWLNETHKVCNERLAVVPQRTYILYAL